MRSYKILSFFFFAFITAQNDFALEDLNPASETYGQIVGPSYFSNTVRVVGFFHEY
tara:strand:- start:187 stop:354 length:168 start_codon:yes stop_codon:yes gene_type:complete